MMSIRKAIERIVEVSLTPKKIRRRGYDEARYYQSGL
jgi:predicted amidophosphoribosyltransferase